MFKYLSRLRRANLLGAAVLATTALAVTACGSSSSSSSSSTSASSSSASSGASSEVSEASAFLEKEDSGKGTGPLPTSSPPVSKGKDIWFISCGEAAGGCAWTADGVKDAVALLKPYGWTLTVFDTKLEPSRWALGVEQAIVAHASAIVLGSIDCGGIKPQLEKAKAAGIPVIGDQAFDCNDPVEGGGASLFTATTQLGASPTLGTDVETWGAAEAALAVVKTSGKVNAILFTNNQNAVTTYLAKGFKGYVSAHCTTCKVVEVPFLLANLEGSALTQKASTALLANPSTNVMVTPYDPAALGVATAISDAGKTSSITGISVLGLPPTNTLIKEGKGLNDDVGIDEVWAGYESVDDLVRIFDKQSPVDGGFGPGLINSTNVTPGAFYKAPVNYAAAYAKLWKVG